MYAIMQSRGSRKTRSRTDAILKTHGLAGGVLPYSDRERFFMSFRGPQALNDTHDIDRHVMRHPALMREQYRC